MVLKPAADLQNAVKKVINGTDRKDTGSGADSDPRSLSPVVLVGFGFGAVAAMQAVCGGDFSPLGVVVFLDGDPTGHRPSFMGWYDKLPGDKRLELQKLLRRFNRQCLKERIRVSYVYPTALVRNPALGKAVEHFTFSKRRPFFF